MAFDEQLAGRVREAIDARAGVAERRMFGGLGFFLGGNLACCVLDDELIVRLPPEDTDEVLAREGVRPMEMRGRPARGWVRVGSEALAGDELAHWVEEGVARAASLPPK